MKGIYFITDSFSLLVEVIGTGIGAVQYRDKPSVDFKTAKKMCLLCKEWHIPFIVNDRVDLALLLDTDGVHLGQTDFPLAQARSLLGPSKIIGATASNISEITQAIKEKADYIGLGHIYPTSTKEKKGAPIGIEILKEACQLASIPVVAIGGIKLEHIPAMKKAGASAVAVCSAISQAASAKITAQQLTWAWNAIYNT